MLIIDFIHIPVGVSLGVVGSVLVLALIINTKVNHQIARKQSGK